MQSDYFAWLSPVVPGSCPATGDSRKRATAGMSPVSPVVPGAGDDIETNAPPAKPCSACGCGACYQAEGGHQWVCWACHPPERGPVALHLVTGGHMPAGEPQDFDTALAAAVAGLELSVDDVRRAMDAEDLADVAAGRISPATVRAFAEHMVEIISNDGSD